MNSKKLKAIAIIFVIGSVICLTGCTEDNEETESGITSATATVAVGQDGLTNEQRNIKRRVEQENTENNLQWLYCISTYTGQIIYQSSVDGKVTSSEKRLNPKTVEVGDYLPSHGVTIGSGTFETREVIQDDGTYGSSSEYIFWYDLNGNYHQQFMTGGVMIHISDYPIQVSDVILNLDFLGDNSTGWD